jgi:hypothetical protein
MGDALAIVRNTPSPPALPVQAASESPSRVDDEIDEPSGIPEGEPDVRSSVTERQEFPYP